MHGGYNPSILAALAVRRQAQIRTPVHYWLSVPVYEYSLDCGHYFYSRTLLLPYEDEDVIVWCEKCEAFIEPPTEPEKTYFGDEWVAYEQDKGLLRERIARELQADGFPQTEAELAEAAVRFGVPVSEIRQINQGLTAPPGLTLPELCKKGKHEMTIENIKPTRSGRQCLMCHTEAQRQRRAKAKKERTNSSWPRSGVWPRGSVRRKKQDQK